MKNIWWEAGDFGSTSDLALVVGETNMSAAVTMERIAGVSPRLKARLAGVIYLLTGVVALDEFAVLGRLVVHGDPAATSANILAHQGLFRLGFAAQMIGLRGSDIDQPRNPKVAKV